MSSSRGGGKPRSASHAARQRFQPRRGSARPASKKAVRRPVEKADGRSPTTSSGGGRKPKTVTSPKADESPSLSAGTPRTKAMMAASKFDYRSSAAPTLTSGSGLSAGASGSSKPRSKTPAGATAPATRRIYSEDAYVARSAGLVSRASAEGSSTLAAPKKGRPLPSDEEKQLDSDMEAMMAEISKKEMSEYRDAFRLFDKDDSGSIDVDELEVVFKGLNYHFSKKQLRLMMNSIDEDGSGEMELPEFVCVMRGHHYGEARYKKSYIDELRDAFEVFDKDGDGNITPEELASIMKALGENLTAADIKEMIMEVDIDGDGNIDFEEFEKLMKEESGLSGAPY